LGHSSNPGATASAARLAPQGPPPLGLTLARLEHAGLVGLDDAIVRISAIVDAGFGVIADGVSA